MDTAEPDDCASNSTGERERASLRQRNNMKGGDVKALGNVLDLHAEKLAQADGGGLEFGAVARGGSGAWFGHGSLLSG